MKRSSRYLRPLVAASIATMLLFGCGPQPQPATPQPATGPPTAGAFDPNDKPSEPPAGAAAGAEEQPDPSPAKDVSGTETPPPEPSSEPGESMAPETVDGPTTAPTPVPPEAAEPAADAVPDAGATTPAPSGDQQRVVSGDWPCWGGDVHRNMVNATTGISIDFQPAENAGDGKHVLWTARLGSQTYGNPVVAGGKVLIGTNNGAEYRPKHQGDRGCVLCFDEKTGQFLWQLTRPKLEEGMAFDWPEVGICSTPCIQGDRAWLVTNRCELVCVDTEGFLDDQNDGPYTSEADEAKQDADIVWILDMMDQLGVRPHNQATSSPVVYQDMVYLVTSNGVDEQTHKKIPAPEAPSFLAVDKQTGKVVWQDNTPSSRILHGQWSSPAMGIVDGQAQVYFPGGDGWLYALDARTGEHVWQFDLNPKDAKWGLAGRGDRNSIIATPVFCDNSVVLGVGQDPEHGDGIGHLYRIDATKKGDLSPTLSDGSPNPNSGQIWHLGGIDADGSQTGKQGAEAFRRTLSTVAVHDGLVYAPDLSGRIHCVDFQTGRRYWEADVMASIWGSPMVADGKVFVGDEDGILSIFATGKQERKLKEIEFPAMIYGTAVIANGVLFINDSSHLYAIATQASSP